MDNWRNANAIDPRLLEVLAAKQTLSHLEVLYNMSYVTKAMPLPDALKPRLTSIALKIEADSSSDDAPEVIDFLRHLMFNNGLSLKEIFLIDNCYGPKTSLAVGQHSLKTSFKVSKALKTFPCSGLPHYRSANRFQDWVAMGTY